MAGHLAHGAQNKGIGNSAIDQLAIDHPVAPVLSGPGHLPRGHVSIWPLDSRISGFS